MFYARGFGSSYLWLEFYGGKIVFRENPKTYQKFLAFRSIFFLRIKLSHALKILLSAFTVVKQLKQNKFQSFKFFRGKNLSKCIEKGKMYLILRLPLKMGTNF